MSGDESSSKLIRVFGHIQFHVDIGLRSTYCYWRLAKSNSQPLETAWSPGWWSPASPKPAMTTQIFLILQISLISLSFFFFPHLSSVSSLSFFSWSQRSFSACKTLGDYIEPTHVIHNNLWIRVIWMLFQRSLLPYIYIKLVAQSCLTLCNVMDCSPPGSSVHGIL